MKRLLVTLAVAMLVGSVALATVARRGSISVMQPDGTAVTLASQGDEWGHFMVTPDGLTVAKDARGAWCYVTAQGVSSVVAHNPGQRPAAETAFVSAQLGRLQVQQRLQRALERAPRRAGTQVPVTGSPRIPVLLVEYTDKKITNPMDTFQITYCTGEKSARKYFEDQSNGKYNPQYDVWGVYQLKHNRAYYGANDSDGNDVRVGYMVSEAVDAAQRQGEINWSDYDNDGDGECDVVIVVYAGVAEDQAPQITDAVWPCQWSLASAGWWGMGDGARTYGGIYINKFAVFNEIYGPDDESTRMDGIGAFVHEYSHCMGLPDMYETSHQNIYYGMSNWSLMAHGDYNDDGFTPCGYTGYEKIFMGWIKPVTPTANTRYTLPVFNMGADSTDVVVKVTSSINRNEYYLLENRRRVGWDAFMPDEGVLITHISYIPSRWSANSVNDQAVQLITIFPADNVLSRDTEDHDLYGNTNHSLTDTSVPAAQLFLTRSGQATGTAGMMGKPITHINIASDGTASFWYVRGDVPAGDVNADDEVDASDVTALVALLLGSGSSDDADVNGDGVVDASDVTALIGIILNGSAD